MRIGEFLEITFSFFKVGSDISGKFDIFKQRIVEFPAVSASITIQIRVNCNVHR